MQAGRDHRLHLHEPRRAARLLRSADRTTPRPKGVLLSLHLKATMMKVSDPIMFGHAVSVYLQGRVREARRDASSSSASIPNNGIGDAVREDQGAAGSAEARRSKPTSRPPTPRGPPLAMVDSDKGITNLHVPERRHHRRVDARGDPRLRPDVGRGRQAARHEGADPRPLLRRHLPGRHRRLQEARRVRRADHGQRPNVGLMAQAAEEYGSHDKTFEIARARHGARRRRRRQGADSSTKSRPGDIWRMCQTKDVADPATG